MGDRKLGQVGRYDKVELDAQIAKVQDDAITLLNQLSAMVAGMFECGYKDRALTKIDEAYDAVTKILREEQLSKVEQPKV